MKSDARSRWTADNDDGSGDRFGTTSSLAMSHGVYKGSKMVSRKLPRRAWSSAVMMWGAGIFHHDDARRMIQHLRVHYEIMTQSQQCMLVADMSNAENVAIVIQNQEVHHENEVDAVLDSTKNVSRTVSRLSSFACVALSLLFRTITNSTKCSGHTMLML